MSLEWEWPTSWDPQFVRSLEQQIQDLIRDAMGKNQPPQLRGDVIVHHLNLGRIPPDISIKEILHVSGNTTKMELAVKYEGDASISLKGLEINLDTCTPSGGDGEHQGDANHLMPFFCPFTMTMHKLVLEGCIMVEFKQTLQKTTSLHRRLFEGNGVSLPDSPNLLPMHAIQHATSGVSAAGRTVPNVPRPMSEALRGGTRSTAGVGILLSGGGRSHMRPLKDAGGQSPPRSVKGGTGVGIKSGVTPGRSGTTFYEMASGQTTCVSRKIKIQCCDDPLKSFSIQSNFDTVDSGARKKVEETLRIALRPVVDFLKTQGFTLTLPTSVSQQS